MILDFNKKIQESFADMQTGKLFRVKLSGNDVWDLYINSFSKESNFVFRDPNSSYYNCNHCKNFIRRYGNIVSIDENNKLVSIFDIDIEGVYENTVKVLSKKIKASEITDVFFETFDELKSLPYESCSKNNDVFKLGIEKNTKQYSQEEAEKFGVVSTGEIRTFNHLHLSLNKEFVDMSGNSIESIIATYRDAKNVFQRGMETISLDTLTLVRDLINQGSLLNGNTHLYKIEQFITLKEEYDDIPKKYKDNWCWLKSYKLPIAKFRNELIGVLCSELSEGEELNKACQSWNKRVDPVNYMKTTAPITKRQIEEARKFVEENGYVESFDRRFATIDDIKVSEILHSNVGKGDVKAMSIFDNVKSTSTKHKRNEFDGVETVHIEKFMSDILPTCTSVEVYVDNKHEKNMVSLTTSKSSDSKPIFKWDNNYSITFNGNLAGNSQIKDAVKNEGGKIDGVLRFSITWNEDGNDIVDMDAHALEPNNCEIYYGTYRKDRGSMTTMSGQLDVDMINPTKMGVENIVWHDFSKMSDGVYKFWIRNFNGRKNKGFKAEVEFDGEIYSYVYDNELDGDCVVATVHLKNGKFSITHKIPESSTSQVHKELYGIETGKLHKVNTICLSPNHWGDNNVGNKHYLFMIEGCKTPNPIRSFHNENLIPELAEHRKVLEVLGTTNMITPSDEKQLSGLGFNSTIKDELIVKLQGTHKRTLKILF